MSIQASPYLGFNGQCREAMSFYKDCLGGELMMQTVAETPVAAQCPAGMQQHIIHSSLTGNGFVIMATDMTRAGDGFRVGNDMAVSLNFDSEGAIRTCFDKLGAGGNVLDPLQVMFWGDLFGVLQDKFGKVWMLNCAINKK